MRGRAVPIPVVASFRKIKNLVKNHGVVAAALRNSTQLVSDFGGGMVRVRAERMADGGGGLQRACVWVAEYAVVL